MLHFTSDPLPSQESQVTVEVTIPQRHHRAVMGPKGCRIQQITRDHEVQIKFPEREESAGQIPCSLLHLWLKNCEKKQSQSILWNQTVKVQYSLTVFVPYPNM